MNFVLVSSIIMLVGYSPQASAEVQNPNFINGSSSASMHPRHYQPVDHLDCQTTNWLEHNNTIKMTNSILNFAGNSGISLWIKSMLDPISLPFPIELRLEPWFLGTLYHFEMHVSLMRLHGLSSIRLIPLAATGPSSVLTGIEIDSLYLDLEFRITYGKVTRRKYGREHCPGVVFWGKCPVYDGSMKVLVEAQDVTITSLIDLWVYECNRLGEASVLRKLWCKLQNSWEYVWYVLKEGISSDAIPKAFLGRFHDAHVRASSVNFRNLAVEMNLEGEIAVLDSNLFGLLQTQINADFQDGLFRDAMSQTLGKVFRDVLNDGIDGVRPYFNTEHLT